MPRSLAARDIFPDRSITHNTVRPLSGSCRNVDRLLRKLPDCDDRAQNAEKINHHFERAATLLFRANQKRVCGFELAVHRMRRDGNQSYVLGVSLLHPAALRPLRAPENSAA